MGILTKRERMALQANLWRWKTILSRNKKQAFKVYLTTILYCIILIALNNLLKPSSTQIDSSDWIQVSSSNATNPNNYWLDSSISSNQTFLDCSTSPEIYNSIAYVLPSDASADQTNVTTQIADQIQQIWSSNTEGLPDLNIQPFESYDQLTSFVKSQNYFKQQFCFAFEWTQFDSTTNQYEFSMYFPSNFIGDTKLNQTNYQTSPFWVVKNSTEVVPMTYTQFDSGFQQLMTTATYNLINQINQGSDTVANFSIAYLPMNTGDFTFFAGLKYKIMAWMLIVTLMFSITPQLQQIVQEPNQLKLENMLRLSGMSIKIQILTKRVVETVFLLPGVIFVSIIGKWIVTPFISWFLLFLLTLLVIIQFVVVKDVITYGFGRGPLARFLSVCFMLIMVIFSVLSSLLVKQITPSVVHLTCIFLPNMQLQWFLFLSDQLYQTNQEVHLNFSNLGQRVYDISFTSILLESIIMTIVWIGLFIYLWPLKIAPKQEEKLRFYYPFTSEYWCPKKEVNQVDDQENFQVQPLLTQPRTHDSLVFKEENQVALNLTNSEFDMIEKGDMEKPSDDKYPDVVINQLSKNYFKFKAVDQLSLSLFKDEILVLLGHNGAGKTTTINMLIGELKATSGQAVGFNKNLLVDDESTTDLISVCPQQNIFISKITVRENLEFFAQFRGIENSNEKIDALLQQLHMTVCAHQMPDKISGGQKRRLQLMIALLGDFKIVLLDEPTSGMDPHLRRETWSILKNMKKDTVMILTTHYMDEAEFLGDRVAIMSKGKLKTCGTPLFLKNKFSDEFLIEITRVDPEQDLNKFNQILLKALEKLHLPSSAFKVRKDEGNRDVYTVPRQTAELFQEIFTEVDSNQAQLNIQEYIVRTSSLEEVFIQIGQKEKKVKQKDLNVDQGMKQSFRETYTADLEPASSLTVFQTYLAMNFRSRIGQCIVGCCMMTLFMSIGLIQLAVQIRQQPDIDLSSPSNVYANVNQMPLLVEYYEADNFMSSATFDTFSMQVNQNLSFTPDQTNTTQSLQNWADSLQGNADYNVGYNQMQGSYYVAKVPADKTINEQLAVAVYGNLMSTASQNVFGSAMLNQIAQWYTGKNQLRISFQNKPLPQSANVFVQVNNYGSTWGNFMIVPLTVVSLISLKVVAKRFDTGYYNLLMTKGGKKYLYVFSIYLTDMAVTGAVLVYGQLWNTLSGISMQGIWVAILVFCLSNPIFLILIAYFFQYAKRKDSSASYKFFAFAMLLIYLMIQILASLLIFHADLSFKIVRIAFDWIPIGYLISCGMFTFIPLQYAEQMKINASTIGTYYWIGPLTTIQVLFCALYWILFVVVMEGYCFKKPKYTGLQPSNTANEDSLVSQERERVKAGSYELETVKVVEFVKKYESVDLKPKEQIEQDRPITSQTDSVQQSNDGSKAVDGVSFGVKKGETFALLGLSGAGKSSTLAMLLGDESISGGDCYLNEMSVSKIWQKPDKLQGIIGYCPQTNSLENFSVEKSLYYLACLVGAKEPSILVESYLRKFDLEAHRKKQAYALSGGNMRKLCCAQAMIGNPQVVLVDEVSAGVDPVARRKVWKAMRQESEKSALILTTHTMEEAECLANKIGIMVAGKFKCFGSLQQIQLKYGSGFEVEMNLDVQAINHDLERLEGENQRWSSDLQKIKQKITLWQTLMRDQHKVNVVLEFGDEFTRAGLFAQKWEMVHRGERIDLQLLMKEIQLQNEVARILQSFTDQIAPTSIISFDGTYLQLRVEKTDQPLSYGRLYSIMEEYKKEFAIKEYSCKQATLEQIFNSFAKQDELVIFNRRLSSKKSIQVRRINQSNSEQIE